MKTIISPAPSTTKMQVINHPDPEITDFKYDRKSGEAWTHDGKFLGFAKFEKGKLIFTSTRG
jgi:hypothetical protein